MSLIENHSNKEKIIEFFLNYKKKNAIKLYCDKFVSLFSYFMLFYKKNYYYSVFFHCDSYNNWKLDFKKSTKKR